MKNTILKLLAISGIILASCNTSKKFQAAVPEDKALFASINELVKHPSNARAQNDFKYLYPQSLERHESAITAYQGTVDINRWDKILRELNALQQIYNTLQSVPGNYGIVKPQSYLSRIETAKAEAAEDFYTRAMALLNEGGRNNALQAYEYFKRADRYVSGYKDAVKKMGEAYESGIVSVVINPIEENNVFFTSNWGYTDFRYRPEDYQESLVRDLGGTSANLVPARFYTDREPRRNNLQPDWELNIRWRNIDPVSSGPVQYNRQVSKEVEIGKDTSGKKVYKTVYATLYITQETYTVRAELEYELMDLGAVASIGQGLVIDDVSWVNSRATYSGDSRALSQDDWMMVNNRGFINPTKGDVLNSLMRKMYPDLRHRIRDDIQ